MEFHDDDYILACICQDSLHCTRIIFFCYVPNGLAELFTFDFLEINTQPDASERENKEIRKGRKSVIAHYCFNTGRFCKMMLIVFYYRGRFILAMQWSILNNYRFDNYRIVSVNQLFIIISKVNSCINNECNTFATYIIKISENDW